MSRPSRIEIMGQPFHVTWEDRPAVRMGSGDYWELGNTEVARQTINIRGCDQGAHQERDTVLHEVIHALVKMTGHDDRFKPNDAHPEHPEEPLVFALSTALLGVLRDNPELVSWLTEAVE